MKDGFHYIVALTQAIERWSRDAAGADRDAFRYRGADLRYAVERALYFFLLNNELCRALYTARSTGGSEPELDAAHAYVRLIAPYVSRGETAPAAQHENARASIAAKRDLRDQLSRKVRTVVRFSDRVRQPGRGFDAAEILFLVIHPKFTRFLQPIVEHMAPRWAFLTVDDPQTESYVNAQNMPGLHLRARTASAGPGGTMGHFAGLCDQYDLFRRLMASRDLSAIVMPEGNAPVHEIARVAALGSRVSVLCVQQGWSPVVHPGFRNLRFDNMMVWGDLFAEMLAPHNPLQRFTMTGIPAPLAPAQQRAPDAPIGAIGFFLQKGGPAIDEADWTEFLGLIGWTTATYPEIKVVVRDHPATSGLDATELGVIGDAPNVEFMNPSTHQLSDALGICDVVVAAYSTTLLEAVSVGAIPLIFGASGMPHYWPDLAAMGAAVEEKSLAGAKASLARLIADPPLRAKMRAVGRELRPRLFAASGQAAVSQIVAEIETAMARRRASAAT